MDDHDKALYPLVKQLISSAGDDPEREEVLDTPRRFAKAWKHYTSGYDQKPQDVLTTFKNPGVDQLIIIPKIDFYSMCEHHLAPFYGQIHIGYIPNGKILGLSKFARLAEIYTRRLQVQERIGQQIAEAVMEHMDARGVGVVIRGIHLCMRSRGVEKQNSEMVTSVQLGFFRDKPEVRAEFLQLINEK